MKEAVENLLETASRALSGLERTRGPSKRPGFVFWEERENLAQLFKELGKVPEQERREGGRLLNEAKSRLEEIFSEARSQEPRP